MKEFISLVSKEKTKDVNPVLFDRTKEPSIVEFIVSGLKVIESLPYIKFVDWKHITDASKIDIKLNRRHIKNKAILKDKNISKIVSIRDTAQEMLQMKFIIEYDGDVRYITKNLLIPSYIDSYHMLINGKEVLPQKQIVDMSTYNQKKSVKLKTTLTPIDVYKESIKSPFENTEGNKFKIKTFILNLFTKELNPLYYYLAKFGLHRTIKYFGFEDIIDVTDTEFDNEINYYFKINKYLFVEVDKRYFDANEFVRTFTYMIYDLFKTRSKLESLDDVEYWTIQLGAMFTTNTKNQLNKGLNVLISFGRILDDITKNTLRLDEKHLQSTHSLIRWLLQNYSELRKKNNHDLTMKRIRCNEVTAFYFIQSMTQRINTLLNRKKLSIESIERIFNWNPDELFRIMISSRNTLLKYDADINCFELLNGLRFSFLGSQGISGGKNIGVQFRDIYPSHLGRIDLNGVSHGKNTALTGFIVPRCKIYGNGFFSNKSSDPDNFNDELRSLKEKFKNKKIDQRKEEIRKIKDEKQRICDEKYATAKFEKRDGKIVIHRLVKPLKHEDTNQYIISNRHPYTGYVRTYRNAKGQVLTEDGKFFISRRKELEKRDGKILIRARNRSDKKHYISSRVSNRSEA